VGSFGALTTSGTISNARNPHLEYDRPNGDVYLVLDPTTLALLAGLSGNQQAGGNAINAVIAGGGTPPPHFLALLNLTGGNLANALPLLSGEAAAGAQQGAFQLGNLFLNAMLDPFVDGRGGIGGANGGGAIGFAPERPELPEDVALAYAKVMKAPVYK